VRAGVRGGRRAVRRPGRSIPCHLVSAGPDVPKTVIGLPRLAGRRFESLQRRKLTTAGGVRPGAGLYLDRSGIPRAAVGASGLRPCSPLGGRRRNLGVKQRRRSAGYRFRSPKLSAVLRI
jgi:hypothetical protein